MHEHLEDNICVGLSRGSPEWTDAAIGQIFHGSVSSMHDAGSVAQVPWDSSCRLRGLVAGHEQACPSDLPHDQLARLQRGPEAAWVAVDLVRSRDGVGRPATFSDAAIQTCLMLKALFGLPLRQTTGLVASLLKLARLDWPVPDFSTLCRRQKDLTVTIPYRPSTGALHRLVDSTGIKALGEGSGPAASTALHGPGSGVRFTWALMQKRSKCGRSR